MSSLFTELKRRSVFRVAAAYTVVAWLLAQVADLALENFGAPDWVIKTILLLLILGLPVAIVLAWAFELTPEGIQREKNVEHPQTGAAHKGRTLNFVIIGSLTIALVYFVYESRFRDEQSPPNAPETTAGITTKSIAVLPFATFGGSETDSYLADGLAETLLNRLARNEELQVAARTSAFKFKNTNEDVRIIGDQLGVATILEGSVQRSGERIRITAQLVNVADGFHMYSETFERELDDIFAVQDEIAQAVVDALEVELLGTPSGSEPNVAAYEELTRLRSALRTSAGDEMEQLIASLQALTREYPNYAEAYATLSEAYLLHGFGAGLIPEDMLRNAIAAGRKAVELAPSDASGYVALGSAYLARGRYIEAAPVVARALELQPGNADVMVMQGELLRTQGRFAEALAITERALLRDPLNANTRSTLARRYVAVGRREDALAALALGLELEPEDIRLLLDRAYTLYATGNIGAAMASVDQVIALDPNNIAALQSRFYILFNAGDYEGALGMLERAETLSRERLADERALYCYETGDTACWHAATTRMLATRNRWFAQIWQARMLYEAGLTDDAIQALLPVVAYFDETGDVYGNGTTRTNLAALYHLTEDAQLRDAALEPVIEAFDRGVANGYDFWELYFDMAAVEAARGDEAAALRHLEEAYARGFRHFEHIVYQIGFDPMRDDPAFQAFIERIRRQ